MTNEDAIKELKIIKILYEDKMKDGDVGIAFGYDILLDRVAGLFRAIEALEKQIPKKISSTSYGGYECPNNCDKYNAIQRLDKYCYNCGQKLDWSE